MKIKQVNDSYLKKELKKITHNKKLKSVLKKLDHITRFRRDDTPNKRYKTIKGSESGQHPVLLIDPNEIVL